MKKYEDRTVIQRRIIAVVCDWCGKDGHADVAGKWIVQEHTGDKPKKCLSAIIDKALYTFYSGSDWDVKHQHIDLCPDCIDKVFVWLESQGCRICIEEDGS